MACGGTFVLLEEAIYRGWGKIKRTKDRQKTVVTLQQNVWLYNRNDGVWCWGCLRTFTIATIAPPPPPAPFTPSPYHRCHLMPPSSHTVQHTIPYTTQIGRETLNHLPVGVSSGICQAIVVTVCHLSQHTHNRTEQISLSDFPRK